MEFSPDRPRWEQVAEVIRSRIDSGVYRSRQPIPSEKQLMDEFGIARGTARKVVAHLRDTGTVYTVANLGTFVTPRE